MNPKTKLLVGILVIGVILIGGWWIWENSPQGKERKQEIEFLKPRCCVECNNAFSNSPISVGTEGVDCTHFIEGGSTPEFFLSKECVRYFQEHPTKVAECQKYDCSKIPQKRGTGACEMAWMGAYYDAEKNKCIEATGSGCGNPFPFNSVSECERLCKKEISQKRVTITTDKTEYEQGATVEITVKNNLNQLIYLENCNPYSYELKEDNKWKTLLLRQCETSHLSEIIKPEEIKIISGIIPPPSVSGVYRWRFSYFIDCDKNCVEGTIKYKESSNALVCNEPVRVYPPKVHVLEPDFCSGKKTIYSNEFTIREKEECSIKTPKTMELKTLYNFSAIDSDYVEVHLPKKLCILSYPYGTDGYYIVQFKGPIYEEYKDQIRSLGGVIYSYIPKHAFIVKMNESVKERVQNLEVVRWVGLYQPAYKLRPYLLSETGNLTLDIGIFDGENTTDVINKIEALEGVVITASGNQIRVLINVSRIPDIANITGVEWIGKYVMPRLT